MVRMEKFAVLLLIALAAVPSLDGQIKALPVAPGALIATVSPQPGNWTEPSVAVNPLRPNQVVVVFQFTAQASYSDDGGLTWHLAEAVSPPQFRMSGDVSTVFDNKGNVVLGFIAFDKLGTFNYWGHGATRNGIFIKRSLDGGHTWEPDLRAVSAQPSAPNVPFEDKPYFVADTSKSPYAGNLYVGWTRWTLTDSRMMFSRSTDDGVSWSDPMEISPVRGLPRDDNGALEGFDGAVAPDGTLYAVWALNDHIVFTSSRDGGKTFSSPTDIVATAPTMFAVEGMDRANGFPQIAADARNGSIYVTWSDYRHGDLDVFCIVSANRGRTWSSPVRVNDDPLHNGADQFFQWLAVDPVSGAVNVAFYDRRQDPQNRTQIVVLARSVDAGKTFANYAWTTTPFNPEGAFMGDYIGLAAWGNRVYGAWAVKPGAEAKTIVQAGVADFEQAH